MSENQVAPGTPPAGSTPPPAGTPPPPPPRTGGYMYLALSQTKQALEFRRSKTSPYETHNQVMGKIVGWWLEWDPGRDSSDPKQCIPARWEVNVVLEGVDFQGQALNGASVEMSAMSAVYSTGAQLLQLPAAGTYVALTSRGWDRGATLEVAMWDGGRWTHLFTPKNAANEKLEPRYDRVIAGLKASPLCIPKPKKASDADPETGEVNASATSAPTARESRLEQNAASVAAQAPAKPAPVAFGYRGAEWPAQEFWEKPPTAKQPRVLIEMAGARGIVIPAEKIVAVLGAAFGVAEDCRTTQAHYRMCINFLEKASGTSIDGFTQFASEFDPYADE